MPSHGDCEMSLGPMRPPRRWQHRSIQDTSMHREPTTPIKSADRSIAAWLPIHRHGAAVHMWTAKGRLPTCTQPGYHGAVGPCPGGQNGMGTAQGKLHTCLAALISHNPYPGGPAP